MIQPSRTILIAGASRGIGCALAGEFARRGWQVIGTARQDSGTRLHEVATQDGRIRVERMDVVDPKSIDALSHALEGVRLDALFVNAGITTSDPFGQLEAVSDDEFAAVISTNALAPMRVIAALEPLLAPDGLVGAMSSGLGSITDADRSMADCYRASKAALNMLMRNYAARAENARRPTVLIAPGWIKTDLGGEGAPFTLQEAVPPVVDVLEAKCARPGIAYLDRFGSMVPW